MEKSYLILAVLLGLYYSIHSLFLHPPVKRFFIDNLYFSLKSYRVTFNIFATLGLIFLIYYSSTIDTQLWMDVIWLKIIGILLSIYGLYMLSRSFKGYDLKEFIGINAESDNTLQNTLVVDGLHKFVRHPIYLATLIILIGYFIYAPSMKSTIFISVTFAYLQFGILLEESKLISKFGKSYRDYKNKVPKLFPNIFKKKHSNK